MTLTLTIALILLLTASAHADALPTLVAFGDSTTAPRGNLVIYANLLQQQLPGTRVINAGVGGNSTALARKRFEQDVLAHDPALVIIQFGINDAAVDVWQGATQPRVSLADYAQNLTFFVQTLVGASRRDAQRGAAVILMTPNPMAWTDELRAMYGKPPYDPNDPDGFNVLLKVYAQKMRDIATAEDVPLVDAYAAFASRGAGTPRGAGISPADAVGQSVSDLLLDGMHPNAKGHALEAELLLPHVRRLLKGE
jgi:lysophospholipase L1-like esterase